MMRRRDSQRRADRRAFRPRLEDGQPLEERQLLSTVSRAAIAGRVSAQQTPGGKYARVNPHIYPFIADSGRAVVITDVDGERYRVEVQGGGTVKATPMANGRVGLLIQGTQVSSELEVRNISGRRPPGVYNVAHTRAQLESFQDRKLNVGRIEVASGVIGGIFGYRTISLSGPIIVNGNAPVNRIAILEMTPGASISTGSDLNTLDVYKGINLSAGNISVGRDLNVLNASEDVTLSNGASILVGRDVGLEPQAPNGTGPGGQGGLIKGNFTINPGSVFAIGRDLVGTVLVQGNLSGAANITVGRNNFGGVVALGNVTP